MDARARHAAIGVWSRAVLAALDIRLDTRLELAGGALQIKHTRGTLLVCNHVSWLDVVVLQVWCPQARFVAKAQVQHWPLVGGLAKAAGALFVNRDSAAAMRSTLFELEAVLAAGGVVALFPEGTTSDGRGVLPFKAGLLEAARRAGCAVQPLSLRYADAGSAPSRAVPYINDDSFAGSLWRLARAQGVVARLVVLPTRAAPHAPRTELAETLHAEIAAAL